MAPRRQQPNISGDHHERRVIARATKAANARTSSNANAAIKRRGTLLTRDSISARSRACSAIPNRARSTGRADGGSGRRPGSIERTYRQERQEQAATLGTLAPVVASRVAPATLLDPSLSATSDHASQFEATGNERRGQTINKGPSLSRRCHIDGVRAAGLMMVLPVGHRW